MTTEQEKRAVAVAARIMQIMTEEIADNCAHCISIRNRAMAETSDSLSV
jgi:hypothetical protein